jgi:beta-galactosidase/beta-glucuronidase
MQRLQKVLLGCASLLHVMGTTQATDAPTPYKVQTPPLDTDWTYKVGTNPWPEHPRPQLRRDNWQNLNGIWTYEAAGQDYTLAAPPSAAALGREIMIPSCVESGLSGIQDINPTNMWFARTFEVPDAWKGKGQTVLLNFEAVDYEATVFLNDAQVGHHVGGYFRFTIDVTKNLEWGRPNKL